MSACPGPDQIKGLAHGVLASVGCNSHDLAIAGYSALTAPNSFLPGALTICLTLYVGFLGFNLMTGGGGLRLSEVAKIGVKVGGVVALTLNWNAFQTLVFNVATETPYEVSAIFTQGAGSRDPFATSNDPLTRLENVRQEMVDSATTLVQSASTTAQAGAATPPAQSSIQTPQSQIPPAAQSLYAMANIVIVSTVGLIALAMVAQAILTALGPAFLLFFLFDSTRGLFVGWVRALVASIIAPITSWGGLMVALATLEPWMTRLADERAAKDIKLDTISTLITFVTTFAGAQLIMAVGAIVITSAFSLKRPERSAESAPNTHLNSDVRGGAISLMTTRADQLAQVLSSERASGGSQHSETRRIETGGGGGSGGVIVSEAAEAAPRLGDAYRRPNAARALNPTPGVRS